MAASGSRDLNEALEYVEPVIDEHLNGQLLRHVTVEEIKAAAFSLGSTKAPGPDGFSGQFYHSAWNEIGNSICSMVLEFFEGKTLLHELNDTTITLIPKVLKPEHVSHF